MSNIKVRKYKDADVSAMAEIWNEVVREGKAFPQENVMSTEEAREFFASQDTCGVAVDGKNEQVLGLFILHPNNVGRCSHIANASYAVASFARGKHIGEKLVLSSIELARELGYKILQFNAVVKSNTHARHLYERVGFKPLGTIPKGFRLSDGSYEDICPYYIEL